jgi:hypothetical protein
MDIYGICNLETLGAFYYHLHGAVFSGCLQASDHNGVMSLELVLIDLQIHAVSVTSYSRSGNEWSLIAKTERVWFRLALAEKKNF